MAAWETAEPAGDRIWLVRNEVFPSNTYLCATNEPGSCVLIDPGTDPEAIDSALVGLSLRPKQIFCTHGHFDHTGSASFFQDKYGAECFLHREDFKTLKGAGFMLMAFRIPFAMKQPRVKDSEDFPAQPGVEVEVIPAPGHTPGSCMLRWGHALFTGDSLYSLGVGLSRLPGEDCALLRKTLLTLWDQLPSDVVVYPGHGASATLATIRRENKPLLDFLGIHNVPRAEG